MKARLPAALALLAALGSWAPAPARAQPDPSFRTDCAGLRAALAGLPPDDALRSVQVTGTLRHVRQDEALTYLGMCGPPDPLVLCVAYERNDAKVGDPAVLSGSLNPGRPDRVLLDPCLQFRPDPAGPAPSTRSRP